MLHLNVECMSHGNHETRLSDIREKYAARKLNPLIKVKPPQSCGLEGLRAGDGNGRGGGSL